MVAATPQAPCSHVRIYCTKLSIALRVPPSICHNQQACLRFRSLSPPCRRRRSAPSRDARAVGSITVCGTKGQEPGLKRNPPPSRPHRLAAPDLLSPTTAGGSAFAAAPLARGVVPLPLLRLLSLRLHSTRPLPSPHYRRRRPPPPFLLPKYVAWPSWGAVRYLDSTRRCVISLLRTGAE